MESIPSPPNITSEKHDIPTTNNNLDVTKFPRDSLIVHIPLNVTADLGIAMKRVRAKRIARYKQLQPHIFDKHVDEISQPIEEDGDKSDQESDDDASQEKRTKEKQDDSIMGAIGSEVRREQFGCTVDYLEAKYARGVMIHDLDERIREKKKKNDGGEDLSVLSDSEAGSCYSENSGQFIDDSDLRTDVAHQVLASSAFGTTKIEADAAKAKGADDDSLGADNHAFFVNIGDLEMEDGWNDEIEEDQDWLNSMKKSKGKKRKRAPKETSAAKIASKDKPSSKKSKTDDKDKKSVEKKKKTKDKDKEKDKDKDDRSSPKKEASKEKQGEGKSKTPTKNSNDQDGKTLEVKSEDAAMIEEGKKETHNLKRRVDRLYKKCVEEIEKLTKENLPQKTKAGTGKCQIIVPEGKLPGEELTISNPHIPGQKLKVKIPKKKSPGDKFTIVVPLPEARCSSKAENKISKECIEALDKYSTVFDEWCQAEAKYKGLLPKTKGADKYKIGVERLKKYDKMVTAFPKKLEVPIEATYLRLVVRRKRQNQSKRKSMDSELVSKPNKPSNTIQVKVPHRGKHFPVVQFNKLDFEVST